ncbi:hypothetical protein Taro_007728 [Colocasia esculenta]|uniref:Uncharacterized protein n=1 Tax=Colocasia esculenta TaxID=4460 RepID=A0A843U188_COLES|nr:hypothetical protein [Colocasia esculenta]
MDLQLCVCRVLRPETLEVPGMDLQLCVCSQTYYSSYEVRVSRKMTQTVMVHKYRDKTPSTTCLAHREPGVLDSRGVVLVGLHCSFALLCGVERKLDLSSVTARLRGSSCVVLSGLDIDVMNQ